MKEKTIFVNGRQITYYRHPDLAGLPLKERRRITTKRWRKANPGMSSGKKIFTGESDSRTGKARKLNVSLRRISGSIACAVELPSRTVSPVKPSTLTIDAHGHYEVAA